MNKEEKRAAIFKKVEMAATSTGHTYKEVWRILYKAFEIQYKIPIHTLYKANGYNSKIAYLMDHEEDLNKLYELALKM